MASLDTNILIRYLLADDARQYALASRLISAAVRSGDSLYIPVTVMLELEWVLRTSYGFSKEQVAIVLADLLSSAELSFESEAAVEVALALYNEGVADFADYVHIALAHVAGESPLWTFDRKASKIDGAKLLA